MNAPFGWKTSQTHFSDDAVFTDLLNPYFDPNATSVESIPPPDAVWQDMHYPTGHPLEGQSIDLAFGINTVPEPSTIVLLTVGFLGLLAYS